MRLENIASCLSLGSYLNPISMEAFNIGCCFLEISDHI